MILQRLLSLCIGYFCGCVLTADLLARWGKKPRLRTLGSGNPGAANAALELGPGWGLAVLAGDVGKTAAACLLCRFALFPSLGRLAVLYAGFGAVLGHNWPFWARFRGGKGVAALCAIAVLYLPSAGAATVAGMLLAAAAARSLSAGAAAAGPVFFVVVLCMGRSAEERALAFLIALAMLARSLTAHMKRKKARRAG